MNFTYKEYTKFIKKHNCTDCLYHYYIYRAFHGQIDLALPLIDLKKILNLEWSRSSKKIIKKEPFEVFVLILFVFYNKYFR